MLVQSLMISIGFYGSAKTKKRNPITTRRVGTMFVCLSACQSIVAGGVACKLVSHNLQRHK